MRLATAVSYLALFPGMGPFYFGLMCVGTINIGSFELERLRPFGSPSLANLVEIPIAATFGAICAASLYGLRSRGALQSRSALAWFVTSSYGAVVAFYFLMPSLPE